MKEKRSEFSKEYLRNDHSREVIVFPEQIHYEKENGELEEIDNSLIQTEEGYRNADNSYEVVITDNEDSRGEVIFKEKEYEIAWQMVETQQTDPAGTKDASNTFLSQIEASDTATFSGAKEAPTNPYLVTETIHVDSDLTGAPEIIPQKEQIETTEGTFLVEEIAPSLLSAKVTDCTPEADPAEEEMYSVKQSKISFDGYDRKKHPARRKFYRMGIQQPAEE